MAKFSLDFLQAINDWQRGYDEKQKPARVRQLRAAAQTVESHYRRAEGPCYRQVALSPKYVWTMGEIYRLEETVSSWTERYEIAQDFKGGVAPEGMGWLPVIFRIIPAPAQVILNLAALYADAEFRAACEEHQSEIHRYSDGIGRYGATQAEVVLEVAEVRLDDVFATGGHSSKLEAFLEQEHVQKELASYSSEARETVEQAIQRGEGKFGPNWLVGERKDRILKKWVEHTTLIKRKYNPTFP